MVFINEQCFRIAFLALRKLYESKFLPSIPICLYESQTDGILNLLVTTYLLVLTIQKGT